MKIHMSSVNCGLEMPPSSGSLRPCPIVIFDEVPPSDTPVPPLMHGICPDARVPANVHFTWDQHACAAILVPVPLPHEVDLGLLVATEHAQVAVLFCIWCTTLCSTCMLIVGTINSGIAAAHFTACCQSFVVY